MFNLRSYILLLIGLSGIGLFFLLRPQIDINSGGPVNQSKAEIGQTLDSVSNKLGFDTDSLAIFFVREQHPNYIKTLRDTLDEEFSFTELNQNDANIQSWLAVVGRKITEHTIVTGAQDVFNTTGLVQLRFDNNGRVIRFISSNDLPNPTFISADDSLMTSAAKIVEDIFEYDLMNYELIGADSLVNDPGQEVQSSSGELDPVSGANGEDKQTINISWVRKAGVESGPKNISIDLELVVKEYNMISGYRTELGYSLDNFTATDDTEPVELINGISESDEVDLFTYLFIFAVFILIIMVFGVGLHDIFKGQVEWKRALFMFIVLTLGVYGWRVFFYMNTFGNFLSGPSIWLSELNNFIFALVVGLYGAMAYIGWEAFARKQKQGQVELIDALWRRMFFIRETGAGLIHGVAIGGLAIGLFSLFTYLTGEFIIQNDSQFGYMEASIDQRLLTLNMSAWTTTWLVGFAQIGVVYGIVHHWIRKEWLRVSLSIILISFFITMIGRLIGTSGSAFEDMLIYLPLGILFYFTNRNYGLLSVITGWWFFAVFFMITPYINSPSIEIAYVSWVQMFLMAGPLIYGFISYRYGDSISEVSDYIPEYEERIAQHLRVEKEIEIARESQYKLMPLQPPKAEGIDVYGFFLPSFEVGGDYFDYVLSNDENGEPEAITMTVVDVSGKAMRAAMPAIFTSGLLLSRMREDCPADILRNVCEPIYSRTDKRTFITCVMAKYYINTGKFSVANAGHCRPILKRKGVSDFIQTPAPHYPLGLHPCVEYEPQVFKLKKGDLLLLYSDGLPEAVNQEGERFGFDEVPRMLDQIETESMTAQEIAQDIKRRVQKFSNYQLADDTTIICLKV
ncbi:PP2C family protein-serine/threonine phosphatase [Balneola sp. MJW-20]|uniref:PP2C family protein-serine/threonine phosphatase n=1 Tax=Gracilimonas aurantiaca TaxID=3234185 RepID=UPI003466CC49